MLPSSVEACCKSASTSRMQLHSQDDGKHFANEPPPPTPPRQEGERSAPHSERSLRNIPMKN